MADEKKNEGIDYTAEGRTPPREKDDSTNEGYDEAVRSGPSKYGVPEGSGGVFGTTGGGTFEGGMHVEERPVDDSGTDDTNDESSSSRRS